MITRKNMKEIIADSLKELMQSIPLNNITVTDIVSNCGTSRQTFYRYYKDKYDVVNWIYSNLADKCISLLKNDLNWYAVCLETLNQMEKEKYFYVNAINCECQNSIVEIIFNHGMINCMEIFKTKNNALPTNDELEFALKFYLYGICKTGEDWAKSGMKLTSEQLAENMFMCMPDMLKPFLMKKDSNS